MLKNLLIIFIILKVFMINAQENCLNGNTYVSMPDPATYTRLNILQFNKNKITVWESISKAESKIHNYKIYNNQLILNDTINWGELKCYKDYFELMHENNSFFQYTKLKLTQIHCSKNELQKIITSSYWGSDLNNKKTKIHISKETPKDKSKPKYELIKINETYMIVLDNQWNFTISKISKEKIEIYGLAKWNSLPSTLTLSRIDN